MMSGEDTSDAPVKGSDTKTPNVRRCRGKRRDNERLANFMDTKRTGRRGAAQHEHSYLIELPSNIVQIIEDIENAKKEREQHETRTELEEIMHRVSYALKSFGDDTMVPRTITERKNFLEGMHAAPQFKIQEKKKEIQRQQELLLMIESYSKNLTERKKLSQEIDDWLLSEDVMDGVETEEEMTNRSKLYEDINNEMLQAFDYADEVVERIRKIGYQLLKDAGYIDSDDEEVEPGTGKKKKKNRIALFDFKDIIDEKGLNKSSSNLEFAMAEIKAIMEQGIRMVKKQNHKNVMRAGVKQIKFIMKSVTKRVTDAANNVEEAQQQKSKAEKNLMNATRYKEDSDRKQKKIGMLENKITVMEKSMSELMEENEDLQAEIGELTEALELKELEIKKHQQVSSVWSAHISLTESVLHESSESTSKVAQEQKGQVDMQEPAAGKTTEISHKRKSVNFTDSMISAATKSMQSELEKNKLELRKKDKLLASTQAKLKAAKVQLEQYNAKSIATHELMGDKSNLQHVLQEDTSNAITSYKEQNASLERTVEKLSTELEMKEELLEIQEKRIREMRDELGFIELDNNGPSKPSSKPKSREMHVPQTHGNTYRPAIPNKIRQTMIRMKQDFQDEITRLKGFSEREKSRHDAAIRRLKQKHEEDMISTFKQSGHLLRAINRFKAAVVTILERENLQLAAGDVRKIPALEAKEAKGDAKTLLAQMAGNAVELLVNVEFKLSQALLNKRLEAKNTSIEMAFIAKELEAQTEAFNKAKAANDLMVVKVREMSMKLLAAEEAISVMRKFENWRYEALKKRYNRLMSEYNDLTASKSKVETEFKSLLKDIEQKMATMMSKRDSMVTLVEEQQSMISQIHSAISKKKEAHVRMLYLSLADQRQNLKVIEKAFQENKLSSELHKLTTQLIKKSIELPIMKLKSLMQRYIAYRHMKAIRDHLEAKINAPNYEDRKDDVEIFIKRIDEKVDRSTSEWRSSLRNIEEQRCSLFDKMAYAFSQAVYEAGVALLVPKEDLLKIKKITSKTEEHISEPEIIGDMVIVDQKLARGKQKHTRKLAPILTRPPVVFQPPSGLEGVALQPKSIETVEKMWKPSEQEADNVLPPIVTIQIPHVLDYEINKQIIAARKTITRANRRSQFPMHSVQAYDYKNHSVEPLSDCGTTYVSGFGDSSDITNSDNVSIEGSQCSGSLIDATSSIAEDSGVLSAVTDIPSSSNSFSVSLMSSQNVVKL